MQSWCSAQDFKPVRPGGGGLGGGHPLHQSGFRAPLAPEAQVVKGAQRAFGLDQNAAVRVVAHPAPQAQGLGLAQGRLPIADPLDPATYAQTPAFALGRLAGL